jgi:hypothetical protein
MRAILLCLLAACGTVSAFMPTNTPPHPLSPKAESDVELFTATTPTRDYVEVGILQAAPASGVSSAGDLTVLAQLRREAAQHGCDGVLVTGTTHGAVMNGDAVREQTAFRAACIVYR